MIGHAPPVFLHKPRYIWGCLGFYTTPTVGRRIIQAGVLLTGLGLIAALIGGIAPASSSSGAQAVFLIASAWVLILGLMRLFWTGAMWIFTQIFEFIASRIPIMSSAAHYLCRGYWIVIEVFLSAAFLYLLVTAILARLGLISLA